MRRISPGFSERLLIIAGKWRRVPVLSSRVRSPVEFHLRRQRAPRGVPVTIAFDGSVARAEKHHVADGACAAAPFPGPQESSRIS